MQNRFRSAVTLCLLAITSCATKAQAQPTTAPTTQPAASRPNVVIILADDMGYSDVGCYGGEIHTPNIDGLAAEGLRLTQFYNMSRCCPTRASLLTGLYPHQAGIGAMNQDLKRPGYEGHLNDRCVTMAEVLGAAGYQTAIVGKWHLSNLTISAGYPRPKRLLNFEEDAPISENKESWPNARGFQEQIGTIAGVESYYDPYTLTHNGEVIKPTQPFYYTDFITDHATQLIDRYTQAQQPFFMYVAYTAPHWPMQAPEEDVKAYADTYGKGWDAIRAERIERQKKLGVIDADVPLSPRPPNRQRFSEGASVMGPWEEAPNKDWQARRMAVYAAMISHMDSGIGKILARLRERGADQNTIVVFMSDNGGCAENVNPGWYDIPSKTRAGEAIHVGNDPAFMPGPENVYQSYGAAWANASNTPFRRFKHFSEEGGISTPFIIRWPSGALHGGGKVDRDQVGHVIDLMPTICEATGVSYPTTFKDRPVTPMEGKSLLSALRGHDFERDQPLFWEHEGSRAVRLGRWKLVAADGENWQLYDVVADRTESHDLADQQPAKAKELRALYDAWAQRCGVQPWPIRN